jgi:hypothetical protein
MLPRDRGRSKVRAGGKIPHMISMKLSFKCKRLALNKGWGEALLRFYRLSLDATLLFISALPRNHWARQRSSSRLLP